MEIVRLEPSVPRPCPGAAVAVGNFDGVHRGHQALLAAARADARARGGQVVVLTFDPHPARVLTPDRAPARLMTFDQKAEVLAGLGVDVLAVLPFGPGLAEESAAAFARLVLRDGLQAEAVVVGRNFRFGRGREGGVQDLERLGGELGFATVGVDAVLHGGVPVSSSRVREVLAAGDAAEAAALLGRPHFLDGTVVQGDGRGRQLGTPTANLQTANETLPARGVYACWCALPGGERQPAVTNLGHRPTFGGGEATIEAHLLDFAGDLYGQTVRLEFVDRLRPERAFPGVDALRAQIAADVAEARRRLAGPSAGGYSQ